MRTAIRVRVVLLSVILFLACSSCRSSLSKSRVISGRVVAVHDGDTITVLDGANVQHKVRLQGIDAPEKSQAFGDASRQSLAALVFGKSVEVEAGKTDRYQRELGKVMLGDRDANLEQLRAGMAWYYREYERELSPTDRWLYNKTETEARSAMRGLWSDKTPTPPWDFRRNESVTRGRRNAEEAKNNSTKLSKHAAGPVIGNRRSHTYHFPGCPGYEKVSPGNRVPFNTRVEAEDAGYRMAKNCPN